MLKNLDHETPIERAQSTQLFDTSDDNLATLFIDGLGTDDGQRGRLRFVPAWNKWLRWTGQRWEQDELGVHRLLMQGHLRRFAARLFNNRFEALIGANGKYEIKPDDNQIIKRYKRHRAKASAIASVQALKSQTKVEAVLRHTEPRVNIASPVEMWDNNPWLLNTPDGVLDLQTGQLGPHDSKHFMTKLAACSPRTMPTPIWDNFLRFITCEDEALARYIVRIMGYCLTGLTSDQTFFFGHGGGKNGKSVFVNILSHILGDYYQNTPSNTMLRSKYMSHPQDLAQLCGARLVTASEISKGSRWDEGRLKELTGGDPITARFLYRGSFTFRPQFKLFIIGNHRPVFTAVNEAIRRRMQLVPFLATIPERQRDGFLFDKLKLEAPGILHHAVQGCLEWQEGGLQPPDIVSQATDDYLEGQDPFQEWLEACCVFEANAFTPSTPLFESWKEWAAGANEFVGSRQQFKASLDEHAVGQGVRNVMKLVGGKMTRGFRGIQLVSTEHETPGAFTGRKSHLKEVK